MTELLLICAIGALGMAFSVSVARWLLERPAGDEELVRAASLVSGGMVRFLRRQSAVAVAMAGVMGAVVLLAYGLAYQTEVVTAVAPREHGVWSTGSYVFGALGGVAAAWVAVWASGQSTSRVAAGARRSLDDSLQIALRAGALCGIVALALSLLGLAILFLIAYLMLGGLGDPAAALSEAPRVPKLLVGFAVGAGFVALLGQLGGGIFGNVADIGADIAGKLEASLPEDAVGNPATVADLVGDHVGDGAGRAANVYACAATESVTAMLVASTLYAENEDLPSVMAVVLFPLVARTFSILAASFGVLVVRTDDTEVPMAALSRGLFVTTLLYGVGALGSAKWLLGPHWLAFGGCAVIGAVWSLLSLFATQYYTEQKHRPVRTLAEVSRGGATLAALRGIVTATDGSSAQLIITLGASLGAYQLGASSGLEMGGLFGLAIAVGGMLGSAPYVLAMDAMGSIADVAGGLIEMTVAAERPDVRARARLLDAVGTTAKSYTRSLTAMVSTLSVFLLLTVFLREVWDAAGHETGIDLESPMLFTGAVGGLLLILVFVRLVLGKVIAAGRDLVHELRVQLLPSDDGSASRKVLGGRLGIDRDDGGARGQLACVEIVSRVALRGMISPAVVGMGLPLLVAVGLRLWPSEDSLSASAEALVALLLVATLAAALGSLLFTHAGSAWDNAKKYIETGAHGGRYILDVSTPRRTGREHVGGEVDNPTYVAAVIGDTIGDPLKGAVGPATQTLVTTLAALALVFLPFFL